MICDHQWQAGCTRCRVRSARYNLKRARQQRAGTWLGRVPVDQVQPHISKLRAGGMTMCAIAAAAGVPVSTVRRMFHNHTRWCNGPTAAALLAVECEPRSFLIDATGTRRRLQALIAIGYTSQWLCRQLGGKDRNAWEITSGHRARVTPKTAEAVAALYDRCWSVPGPSNKARGNARRNGWVSPLAWDDDTIDDPAATPAGVRPDDVEDQDDECDGWDHGKVARAVAGDAMPWRELTATEKTLAVAELAREYTDEIIAARLRTSHYAVMKWRSRYGIPTAFPPARQLATAGAA